MEINIASENSLILYAQNQSSLNISPDISAWLAAAISVIESKYSAYVIDMVPSYASILIIFDIDKIDPFQFRYQLSSALADLQINQSKSGKLVRLPVFYNAPSTPDAMIIAEQNNVSVEDVIEIHQAQSYQVYAIGFAPGFAFLGEVDSRIAAPRLATPRHKVPRGAVAIADRQTAVYPSESPGGWNLIGLCPTAMFNKTAEPPMPIAVGDTVQFYAVTKDEFIAMGGAL